MSVSPGLGILSHLNVIAHRCQLVNQALLDHLISHCQLDHHFLALKRFLLLEDGEFGHALSTKLCQQLHFGSDWQVLCSPSFLNPLLASALEFSLHHHSLSAPIQLGFSLLYQPHNIHCNGESACSLLQHNTHPSALSNSCQGFRLSGVEIQS